MHRCVTRLLYMLDRWWEARIMWGQVLNVTRNLVREVIHFSVILLGHYARCQFSPRAALVQLTS